MPASAATAHLRCRRLGAQLLARLASYLQSVAPNGPSAQPEFFSLSHKCFDVPYCEINQLAGAESLLCTAMTSADLDAPELQKALSHDARRLPVCATGCFMHGCPITTTHGSAAMMERVAGYWDRVNDFGL